MNDPRSIQALLEENRRLQELGARAQELEAQNQALQSRVQELEELRRNLEHLIAVYQRHLFGSRSEKIDPQELEARIGQAAQEAREQMAKEKRPGDPPPEAEEEQPEKNATAKPSGTGRDKDKDDQRKARPAVEGDSRRICRVGALSIRSSQPKRFVRAARIIPR